MCLLWEQRENSAAAVKEPELEAILRFFVFPCLGAIFRYLRYSGRKRSIRGEMA